VVEYQEDDFFEIICNEDYRDVYLSKTSRQTTMLWNSGHHHLLLLVPDL